MGIKVVVERQNRILDDFFKVDEAIVRFELRNGQLSKAVRRLSFERGDSVAVLIFNSTVKHIVLVKQFKYPTFAKGPGWIIETAAGMINTGEDAEAAARREVFEEVGYSPARLEHISTFYVSPGGSSERIIMFYAKVYASERVGKGGGLTVEGEDIETIELSVPQALEEIERGVICDAKTILAIYWLRRFLQDNPEE